MDVQLIFLLVSLCLPSNIVGSSSNETEQNGEGRSSERDGKFFFIRNIISKSSCGGNDWNEMEWKIKSSEERLGEIMSGIRDLVSKVSSLPGKCSNDPTCPDMPVEKPLINTRDSLRSSAMVPGSFPTRDNAYIFSPDNRVTIDNSNDVRNTDGFSFTELGQGDAAGTSGDVTMPGVEEEPSSCFSVESSAIGRSSTSLSRNSPTICSGICQSFSFPSSAVQGQTCNCLTMAPDSEQNVDRTLCNIPCSPNADLICGGPSNFFTVTPSEMEVPELQGTACLQLTDSTIFQDTFRLLETNTPETCGELCLALQFNFAAVQGSSCSCLSQDPSEGALFATCDIPCPGDSKINCGGEGAFTVTGTEKIVSPSPPPVIAECIEVDVLAASPFFEEYIDNFTPITCLAACRLSPSGDQTSFIAIRDNICGCYTSKPTGMTANTCDGCPDTLSGTCEQTFPAYGVLPAEDIGSVDPSVPRGGVCVDIQNIPPPTTTPDSAPPSSDTLIEIVANSPSVCSSICRFLSFDVFGVNGERCLCLNEFPPFTSSNNQLCPQDCSFGSTEKCGGSGNRFSVYLV